METMAARLGSIG